MTRTQERHDKMAGESREDKVRSYLEIYSSKHLNCSAGVGKEGGREGREEGNKGGKRREDRVGRREGRSERREGKGKGGTEGGRKRAADACTLIAIMSKSP